MADPKDSNKVTFDRWEFVKGAALVVAGACAPISPGNLWLSEAQSELNVAGAIGGSWPVRPLIKLKLKLEDVL